MRRWSILFLFVSPVGDKMKALVHNPEEQGLFYACVRMYVRLSLRQSFWRAVLVCFFEIEVPAKGFVYNAQGDEGNNDG